MNILLGKRLHGNTGRKTKRAPFSFQYPLCFDSSLSKHAEAADKKAQSWVFQTATTKAHQCSRGLSEGLISTVT